MFYEESVIKNLLKCQICYTTFEDYNEPFIIKECGKTICNNCVENLKHVNTNKNTFKCDLCTEEHLIANNFIINETILKLIKEQPKEFSRGKDFEQLKLNVKELEANLERLMWTNENGIDEIKTYCLEQKRLIQLNTEKKIQEINDLNESLIQLIDLYEKEKIEQYNKDENVNKFINETNEFINVQKIFLKKCQIDDEEIKNVNKQFFTHKTQVNDQLKNMQSLIFKNELIKFISNENLIDNSMLGSIDYEPINYVSF